MITIWTADTDVYPTRLGICRRAVELADEVLSLSGPWSS